MWNHLRRFAALTLPLPRGQPSESMKTKLTRIALLLAVIPLTPVAMAQTKEETKKPAAKEEKVVKVVKAGPEAGTLSAVINDSVTFSILAKALKAADLEATLGDTKGSYTIFAPT